MIALTEQVRKIRNADDLLGRAFREQQDLSAVDRYAREHEAGAIPAQAKFYSDLMPATPPRPGQQYAFEVDLDRCTSCKACVTACHNLNGLDPGESWRSTGMIVGGSRDLPFRQTVTASCHHCAEPACLSGCPVKAYEKDPDTGIVRHLDDQCIGCKYCQLTCPYDVPKYSPTRGIVRKCDMCSSRLGAGEAPACVQACPNHAIRIKLVDVPSPNAVRPTHALVPGAPSSRLTRPTTLYRSKRMLPANAQPEENPAEHKEPAHLPLVVMLVISQLSVGMFLFAQAPAIAAATGVLSMVAALFHLGRPQFAFRAILGLRTSWLSREILVFGMYMPFAALALIQSAAYWPAAFFGIGGVFCSVMVYAVTGRPTWNLVATACRFFGTTLILGLATLPPSRVTLLALTVIAFAKLAYEASAILGPSPVATLLKGELRNVSMLRFLASIAGVAAMPFSPIAGLLTLLAGELLERYLFFTACVAPRMPGGPGR